MPRGGARPGAGRKPKPLAEKIAAGNPGGRALKKVDFAGQNAAAHEIIAPDYLLLMDRGIAGIPTPTEVFAQTVDYLRPSGCLHLIPILLLCDYVMAKYHLLVSQYELSNSRTVMYDKGKELPYITSWAEAMLKMQKNALAAWAPIWEIVRQNSQVALESEEERLMGSIMDARKRKNSGEGAENYAAARYQDDPGD